MRKSKDIQERLIKNEKALYMAKNLLLIKPYNEDYRKYVFYYEQLIISLKYELSLIRKEKIKKLLNENE